MRHIVNASVLREPKRRFRGEGDVYPSTQIDLVVTVELQPHPRFSVQGHDLLLRHPISLRDALTARVLHIDDIEGASIQIALTGIVNPNTVVEIQGRGLRKPEAEGQRGVLKISFDIQFPEFLPEEDKAQLLKFCQTNGQPNH